MQFLEACYLADEMELAKKVSAGLQKDLEQQLTYYKFLGEEGEPMEQMVNNAYQLMQGKGGYLSDRQLSFLQDIVMSYQLLQQVESWKKKYQPSQNS